MRAGGECATTRSHLRGLVAGKIAGVREQVEECLTFLRQLEAEEARPMENADGCALETTCHPVSACPYHPSSQSLP